MKNRLFVWLVLALVPSHALAQAPPPLVFTDVNVISMEEEGFTPGQDVLIIDGIIRSIGKDLQVPLGAIVVEAKDRFLMPGLADMHAHLPGEFGETHALDEYLYLQLAAGVTTLRVTRGGPDELAVRERVQRGEWIGPRIYVAAPAYSSKRPIPQADLAGELEGFVREGYDFVKFLSGSPDDFDRLAAACREQQLSLVGHAPGGGLRQALEQDMASVEHILPFLDLWKEDPADLDRALDEMARQGNFTCPDVFWYEISWLQHPLEQLEQLRGIEFVAPEIRARWSERYVSHEQDARDKLGDEYEARFLGRTEELRQFSRILHQMQSKGVPILTSPASGTFVVPGFGMHEEMRIYRRAGLTPWEILQSTTTTAARFFGIEGQDGTIAPGQRADLILLQSNPLEDIGNLDSIAGVVADGHWHSGEDLRHNLQRIQARRSP